MIMDGALMFDGVPTVGPSSLTPATAGTPYPSANVLDFSTPRDLGVTEPLMLFVACPTLPTSATSGATLGVVLQGSPDDATWTTMAEYGPFVLPTSTSDTLAVRTQLPYFGTIAFRYLRLAYVASAALTAGTVEAGIALNVPRNPSYPRNFVA